MWAKLWPGTIKAATSALEAPDTNRAFGNRMRTNLRGQQPSRRYGSTSSPSPSGVVVRASTLNRPPGLKELANLKGLKGLSKGLSAKDLRDMKELGMDSDLKDLTIRDVKVGQRQGGVPAGQRLAGWNWLVGIVSIDIPTRT